MASVGVISVTLIPSPTNATAPVTAARTTSNQTVNKKPIRKPRPTGSHAQAAISQPWSSSRCFRLLRSFTSRITALKSFLQSTPSAVAPTSTSISAANPNASIPASEALSALITSTSTGTGSGAGLRKTSEVRGGASEYRYGRRTDEEYRPENDINIGGRRRAGARAPVRTYGSGSGTMMRTNSSHCASDLPIAGGASTAGKTPANGNGSNSYRHLMAQRQSLNYKLFGLYLAIYQCLSKLLQTTMVKPQKSTRCPSSETPVSPTIPIGAPSLVTLATRALAHCILATSPAENPNSTLLNYNQTNRDEKRSNKQQEIPQSDWYDGVQDVSATYLPTLLRFHVIEVVAQSIRTRGIDCNLGSMLAGLCYEAGAMHEGDVIVRELLQLDERRGVGCIFLYLLSANKEKHPGLLARGWRMLKEHGSRRLPEVGIDVLANIMGGVGNRALRERAWKDWMYDGIEEAKEFVSGCMRIAFGVWGAAMRDDVRMKMCRMDKLKRNGSIKSERAAIGVSMVAVGKLKKLVYGNNTLNKVPAKRTEDLVLEFLDVIAKTALGLDPEMETVRTRQAKDVLWDLVEGFLRQSGEVRNVVEVVWGRGEIGGGRVRECGYPKYAKVLVLLFVLVGLEGEGNEEKREQVSKEIARVLEEEKYAAVTTAKLAAMNTVSTCAGAPTIVQPADEVFMEDIVDHLLDFYGSDGISAELGQEGVRKLVKTLMEIAFPTISQSSPTIVDGSATGTNIPATPAPKTPTKKLTWTPVVNTLSPEDEATSIRYYHSRLALLLATHFSSLPETKCSEKWVEWVEEIEKKILCMPIPTPARKPAHHQRRRKALGEKSYQSARKPKHGSLGWKFEEGLGAWIARTGATPAKNSALSDNSLGAAVRRSSRLSFASEEGAEEAGGRKWVFGGVVLTPMGVRSRDGYELFFTSDSEESGESEKESDEAIGVTECEDNGDLVFRGIGEDVPRDNEVGEVISINDSDEDSRSPLFSTAVKKRSMKYVLPTSASSLSSEGEYDFEAESLSWESLPTSSFSPLIPPASTRPKRPTRSITSISTYTCTPYCNMRQCNQRHRQSSRTAALAPKSYVIPDSSSADEGEDSWTVGQDETPDTSLSMLSSPPPEERRLRPRGVSEEKKQLSLLEFGGDSPVPTRAGSAMKRKAQALDTPCTDRSLRKRAKVGYKEEDTEGDSTSEADNEMDEGFAFGDASKRGKFSGGVGMARSQSRKRRARNESTAAPAAKIADVGHEDVFLDGNKWDVQARNAKAAQKGVASGVYSSPPESTKSDDDGVEMESSFDSGEEKEDPKDEEFLISPLDSQTGNVDTRKHVQLRRQPRGKQKRRTRSSQEFSKPKGAQKRSAMSGVGVSNSSSSCRSSKSSTAATMSLKKVFSTIKGEASSELGVTKVEPGRRSERISRVEKASQSTRGRRSVSAKNYAELPDEEGLSADELCA